MRKSSIQLLTLLISITSIAQVDSINQNIFLVGDAGGLQGTQQPVVDWLKKHVNWNDEKNTVIYLGDNIYPLGLPMEGEPGYKTAKEILDSQIDLVKGKKARGFFVLGNHDWKNGKLGGWQQAMNQENYINGLGQENIQAWPTDGCPGPVAVEITDKIVTVFIDSQWFLYVHEKPGPGSSCNGRTIEEFATELKEIVAMHPNQLLLLVTHHPMYTFGVHGGDYTWREHLFPFTAINPKLYIPLPVLGSIYPLTRGIFGSLQDVRHPLYKNMVNTIERIIKVHPNPIGVAGHDHSLQMIVKDSIPYIVSGSGINLSRVKQNRKGELLFSDVAYHGFAMLEVRKSGYVAAKFYNTLSADINHPTYVHQLDSIKILPEKISKDSIPQLPDSAVVIADEQLHENKFRNFFMGKNYRKEWTTPIKVAVLNLGTEQGGLTPRKQGGGKQTKSLRVEDKNGNEWALRSIQKFPEAAIPPDLRSPFALDIVKDGISASYPFASLSIEPFAKAAGLPILRRKLVYIPDDPRLGRFRNTFKNTLAILEERNPEGVKKTYNTDELILRLAKDNDDHVDQQQVLKARLLDNFYMDLDRHEGQWRWATRDTGKGKIYYAVPHDQDQVFHINEGFIPSLVKKPWLVPELQGIRKKAYNIKTFNRAARNFDRFFLNELNEDTWRKEIDTFLNRMTDTVITKALMLQPDEIKPFHAQKLINILGERKKYFTNDMLEYYKFISKEVNIVGTNQKEFFTIDKKDDGKIQVTINKITKKGEVSSKIYDRIFNPAITKELRIYGLEDADSFVIKGGSSPIRIRIIGGPGQDSYVNEGTGGKVRVYDVAFEENHFSGNSGLRKKISLDPRNNQYNRIFYKYDIFHPGLTIAYNIDDGIFPGFGVQYTKNGFRREPYAMKHSLAIGHALKATSWYFKYDAEIIKAIGNSDVVIHADIKAPTNVTNFFGLGNNTSFDKNNPAGVNYYRARYNISNVSVFLRRQLQSWMRVNVGPAFQTFKLPADDNKGKFVNNTLLNGLDPATIYTEKTYLGGEAALDINSKNNQVIPTRGFVLDAGIRKLFGVNSNSHNVTQIRWDMRIFASFVTQPKVVIATRFGYGHNIGKYEFQQAQYLSGPENLRGFRRNRFAGRTMLYNNTELRIKLSDFNTYLFPGALGLQLFNDIGRVWVDGENSNKWHDGYGFGIWVAPIQRFVITASVARSQEEKILPYVTFGFQF